MNVASYTYFPVLICDLLGFVEILTGIKRVFLSPLRMVGHNPQPTVL
jgi:hypothetical protein